MDPYTQVADGQLTIGPDGSLGTMIGGKFVPWTPENNTQLSSSPAGGWTPDPTYLTWLRKFGYSQAEAYRQAQAQVEAIRRQFTPAVADIKAEGEIARRGIEGNAESRGIYRSGELLRNLADERAREGRRVAQIYAAGADNLANVRTQLASQLAGLNNTGAEQDYALAMRRTTQGLQGLPVTG